MKQCRKCSNQLNELEKFCGQCGASSIPTQQCSACKAHVPIENKFCQECGHSTRPTGPQSTYRCECGNVNSRSVKFCPECSIKSKLLHLCFNGKKTHSKLRTKEMYSIHNVYVTVNL